MSHPSFSGPLLVAGASRSGTSYLRRLANALSGVHLEYEFDILRQAYRIFKTQDVLRDRTTFLKYIQQVRNIQQSNVENRSFRQGEEFYCTLYSRLCEDGDFAAFIERIYRADREHEIWGDKCELSQIDTFFELYPQSRLMITVRDPRAVASSFHEHSGVNCSTTSLAWVSATRLATSLPEKYGEDQVLVVRFEDLLVEHVESMQRIAQFVGREISVEAEEIEGPRTESISKWRGRLSMAQVRRIESICFDEMQRLGYETEQATAKKNIGRLSYGFWLAQHTLALLRHRRMKASHVLYKLPRLFRYLRFHRDW